MVLRRCKTNEALSNWFEGGQDMEKWHKTSCVLWLCNSLSEESGIEIDTDIDLSEERLTQETKMVLFRVTQEALANIRKHSQASRAELRLKENRDRITLTIEDNGIGFVPSSRWKLRCEGKAGLVGIQERVGLIDGSFELRSKAGQGTTVRVEIPL